MNQSITAAPTIDGEATEKSVASEAAEEQPPSAVSNPDDGVAALAVRCDVPVDWLAELGTPDARDVRPYGTGRARIILRDPITGETKGSQHWPAKKHITGSRRETFGVQTFGWLNGDTRREVIVCEGIRDWLTLRRWSDLVQGPAVIGLPGAWTASDVVEKVAPDVDLIVLCLDNDKPDKQGKKPGEEARTAATCRWRTLPDPQRPALQWVTGLEAAGIKDVTSFREKHGWESLTALMDQLVVINIEPHPDDEEEASDAESPAENEVPTLPAHPQGCCAWCGKKLPKKQRKTRRWCNDNCKVQYRALERVVQRHHNNAAQAAASRPSSRSLLVLPDTVDGLQDALDAIGVELRWNIRSNIVEVNDPRHNKTWEPLSELHEARLQTDIWESVQTPEQGRWSESPDRWARHTKSILFGQQTDPFRDWLDSLLADPAIPLLPEDTNPLTGCFDVPGDYPGDYCLWVAQLGFDEVIAMSDGIERSGQIVPVLYSALQGIGKSAFWSLSLPADQRRHWFSDAFDWTASNADIAGLAGVFNECQEMGGMSQAGRERVKAVITAEFSKVRFPYDRRHTEIAKRSLVVCSDNRKRCLPADETGNRRFAPITVQGVKGDISRVMRWWDELREPFWKTRAKAVREGRGVYLCPPGMQRTWEAVLEEHRWQHPDEQKALDWLEDHKPPEVALEDVIYDAKIRDPHGGYGGGKERFTDADRKNVGKALRALGYEERRVTRDSQRLRLWLKPQRISNRPTGGQ